MEIIKIGTNDKILEQMNSLNYPAFNTLSHGVENDLNVKTWHLW
jgi:hypothetical protein